jgi:hypothetical protein
MSDVGRHPAQPTTLRPATRRATFAQSIARLQQATSAAVSTLLKIMVDATAPPSARVPPPTAFWPMRNLAIADVAVRVVGLEAARCYRTASNEPDGSTVTPCGSGDYALDLSA